MPTLWPDINLAAVENTPMRVLEDARVELQELTGGRVLMGVGQTLEGDSIRVRASLSARGIHRVFPLLEASMQITERFPVKIITANPPRDYLAKNETDIVEAVKQILSMPETVETVQRLFALAR